MRLSTLVLASLLTAPCVFAQSETPAHRPLPVAFSQTLSLPGERSSAPPIGAIRSTHRIVSSDVPFGQTLTDLLALAGSEDHADNALAVQAISGIGLRWAIRNATEWAGNASAVAELLAIHAAHGGIMYAEMVRVHDVLVWHLPEAQVSQIRDHIIATYRLRVENPCDECTDDPFAFVVHPDSFNGAMQAGVQAEADAHRAALSTIAGWSDDD